MGIPTPDSMKKVIVRRQDILNAFYRLSCRRSDDYAMITDSQIIEHSLLHGANGLPHDKFMQLVNALDITYLNAKSAKAQADNEAMKHRQR
jgi:hypothetical protein